MKKKKKKIYIYSFQYNLLAIREVFFLAADLRPVVVCMFSTHFWVVALGTYLCWYFLHSFFKRMYMICTSFYGTDGNSVSLNETMQLPLLCNFFRHIINFLTKFLHYFIRFHLSFVNFIAFIDYFTIIVFWMVELKRFHLI